VVNKKIGHATRFIGGTKGSHLVLDHPELRAAVGESEFFFENKDGRIVLIFPLHSRVMIGTSDLPVDNPDDVRCTDTEVDYFLGMVERVFPNIQISREQIVFKFSGVRPLEHSGAKTTGQISRDHTIQVISGEWTGLSFPIYSLVGGKWTSFRAFGEQVTDKTLAFLGKTRQKSTESLPIGGGRAYPRTDEELKRRIESLTAWTGLPAEHMSKLFMRYGTRLEAMADYMRRAPDQPLKTLADTTQREIAFVVLNEKVVHLDDLLLRRSMLAMLGMLTRESVEELAEVTGELLGWDAEQKQIEVTRVLAILADRHGVQL
jgi:glycerol-3-phosphate dehydrogenase